MVHIKVIGVSQIMVNKLMNKKYLVDLHFHDKELFNKAISLGFNQEIWEKKNRNSVIILNNKNCYRCEVDLSGDEYGKCDECIRVAKLFMSDFKEKADSEYRKLPWWKKIRW